ncbi:hypothetical protein [Arthrobacter psychrochitiniphilus]|uniref:NERD domain-containing protein n=1 Tax=Arthrobacter psychrochitiniphilus TaxID=291045 RepID=A0A2V3DLX5_9MICC|nr:hypothetical protein [Arthrobacter psychrochitiniphilus]NYG15975.1 hypothetical protein [Arthrobacter psychrochitiniphilus]PXA63925.1 hypothetical protein CVS29_17880 [Arthrobacter psychrochitiniphilus]
MTDIPADEPMYIRLLEQELAALHELTGKAESLEETQKITTHHRDMAVQKVRGIIAGLDAFDAVGNLLLASLPVDNDAYVESQHESLSSVPELAALLFAEQQPREVGQATQTSGHHLAELHDNLQALLRLESRRLHIELRIDDDKFAAEHYVSGGNVPSRIESRMRLSTVATELYVRNRQYPDKERALISDLFSPPGIDSALREIVGYGVDDALQLFDSTASRLHHRLRGSYSAASSFLEEQLQVNDDVRSVIEKSGKEEAEAMNQLIHVAAFQDLANFGSFSAQELANESIMDLALVEKILTDFSFDIDAQSENVVSAFLAGDNLVKRKPFASRRVDGERRWLLIQPTSFLYGIRPALEDALNRSASANRYTDHRGSLLESKGLAELVKLLNPDVAYQSVYYQGREGNQQFEGDGLLLIDRFALIVEMKSKPRSPAFLTGNPGRMFLDLKQIVLAANRQANRLGSLLDDGQPFSLQKATPLDGKGLPLPRQQNVEIPVVAGREILTIVLSLDDLNAVSTVVEELNRSGLLENPGNPPWITNQHDLEIIGEVIDRPSEFIHYLLRRREANIAGSFRATEELDYFMMYLTRGLYSDSNETGITVLPSLTDELNAWYEFTRGDRTNESAKPRQPIPMRLASLLNSLNDHRPYGWLSVSVDLLDLDGELRNEIADIPMSLRNATRADGQEHAKFVGFGVNSPGKRRGILFLSFPPRISRDSAIRDINRRLRLRKHAHRLDYLAVVSFGQRTAPFDIFAFNDSVWEPNAELDELCRKAGYKLIDPTP